jgi:hypothetical protein
MLDIIPYVSVTVKVHVLLFKPRVGAKLGAAPAFRTRAAQRRRTQTLRRHATARAAAPLARRRRMPSCTPRARRPLRGARARRATRTPPAPALPHAR